MAPAALGRKHYVSQSALEAVLQELKETPLPDAGSRRTIKRARDEHIDVQTPLGSLITHIATKLQKDESQVNLPVLNLPPFFMAFVQRPSPVRNLLPEEDARASEWARSCMDHDTVFG